MTSTTSKLGDFDRIEAVYKTVNGHDIPASIYVPRNAARGPKPVIVRWHGGALINGARNFEEWWPSWTVKLLAAPNSAIIINPDYRLLPEATGTDILSDLSDFYTWLHATFPSILSRSHAHITPDLSRTLITGESAGGYLAIQTALLHSTPDFPKAVLAHHPMLDMRDILGPDLKVPDFVTGQVPVVAPDFVEKVLAGIKPGTVVTERVPGTYETDLFTILANEGRYAEVLGEDSALYPLENLERVNMEERRLPPTWMFHGKEDGIIPAKGTVKFEERVKEFGLGGDWQLRVDYVDGVDHGFDGDDAVLGDRWLKEGLEWLKEYWS